MKIHAKDHPSYNSFSILALIIPLVGIIMGADFLTKETPLEKKLGEHLIIMAILGMVLGALIWTFVL